MVVSWFAGLFYLPRIFVNLAQETNNIAYDKLMLMANKLYRFMTILAVFAIAFGLALYFEMGKQGAWMHAKLFFVFLLCGYHHGCKKILYKFATNTNKRSHIFYRWYNEIPVLLLLIITYLVVLKPF
jgi:putative membrane protein